MFIVNSSDVIPNPVQNLKVSQDTPLDQFCVLVSTAEIEELNSYLTEITYDPAEIKNKIQKVLLLCVAALRFIILSFEEDDKLGDDLLKSCENLCKNLYIFYKDINILLIHKELHKAWRNYLKWKGLSFRIFDDKNALKRVESSRDRILIELRLIDARIKSL